LPRSLWEAVLEEAGSKGEDEARRKCSGGW